MIKKILLGLGLIVLGFIGFSNAGYVRQIGQVISSPFNNSYDINVLKYGSFLSNHIGYGKPILYLKDNYVWFWHYNSNLGFNSMYNITQDSQGFVNNYVLCDELTGLSDNLQVYQLNCGSPINITTDTKDVFYNFFSTVTTNDFYLIDDTVTSNYEKRSQLCISSSQIGKSICFGNCYVTLSVNTCYPVPGITLHQYESNVFNSLGYSGVFTYINTTSIGSSPGSPSNNNNVNTGVVGIPLETDESALNYYENHYGWDESICYAGVNSLSYFYGQNGVSFQKGKGLNIFQVFSGIYGNSDIDKVYVWLNSQLLNYEQWFYRDGDPLYLSVYNSGTNQVDLYYDNLTFPFSNKPVAFFFLADNITSYSSDTTMGSSVVSYCNIKLNSGSFDDIIDQADKNNITKYTEQENSYHGLNPDGSNKDYGVSFSGDVTIKTSLENFFEKFNGLFNIDLSDSNQSGSNLRGFNRSSSPVLPGRLVTCLLFVVFFKFIRKR